MEITDDIRNVAGKIANLYKDRIEDAGAYATLKLWDFTWDIEMDGRYVTIVFNLPLSNNGFPYWRAIEEGTKPHWMPIEAIKQWIKVKPIKPVPRAGQKKVPSTDQLAYAIQWGIARKGTKGKHLLAAALNDADNYINEIIDLLAMQIQDEINKEDV